jgi:hypothetical protein
MMSPVYTPFSAFEVREVLGLSKQFYDAALADGRLQRSVHFEARYSSRTSLHNLVDVVLFDALHWAASEGAAYKRSVGECEDVLDCLCCTFDTNPGEVSRLSIHGQYVDLVRLIWPFERSANRCGRGGVAECPSTIRNRVVSSWCINFRKLAAVLQAESHESTSAFHDNSYLYAALQGKATGEHQTVYPAFK